VKRKATEQGPAPHVALICPAVSGAAVTVTLNGAEPRLPWLSVVKQSTCVVPSANSEPEAGEHVAVVTPSTRVGGGHGVPLDRCAGPKR